MHSEYIIHITDAYMCTQPLLAVALHGGAVFALLCTEATEMHP